MIKSKKESRMIEVDLTGPDGSVFYLIGLAKRLANQMNRLQGDNDLDPKAIQEDMMSGDYDHAVDVLEEHFGHIVIMYK